MPAGAVDFFVELHIEQGPLLEAVRRRHARAGGAGAPGRWQGRPCVLPLSPQRTAVRPLPPPTPPPLAQEETDIGVVTAIAAPAALEVHFSGDGGHAGAQLMPLRCARRGPAEAAGELLPSAPGPRLPAGCIVRPPSSARGWD